MGRRSFPIRPISAVNFSHTIMLAHVSVGRERVYHMAGVTGGPRLLALRPVHATEVAHLAKLVAPL